MAKIRLWKLGSLEHKIIPLPEAIDNLQKVIDKWDKKSDFDIVWGPELTLEQYDVEDSVEDIIRSIT